MICSEAISPKNASRFRGSPRVFPSSLQSASRIFLSSRAFSPMIPPLLLRLASGYQEPPCTSASFRYFSSAFPHLFAAAQTSTTQSTFVKPGDNLVIENIPPIPVSIAEQTARYGDSRSASLFSWNPVKRELLIGTRFADTNQVHLVKIPGGERKQLTFFPDRVLGAANLSRSPARLSSSPRTSAAASGISYIATT